MHCRSVPGRMGPTILFKILSVWPEPFRAAKMLLCWPMSCIMCSLNLSRALLRAASSVSFEVWVGPFKTPIVMLAVRSCWCGFLLALLVSYVGIVRLIAGLAIGVAAVVLGLYGAGIPIGLGALVQSLAGGLCTGTGFPPLGGRQGCVPAVLFGSNGCFGPWGGLTSSMPYRNVLHLFPKKNILCVPVGCTLSWVATRGWILMFPVCVRVGHSLISSLAMVVGLRRLAGPIGPMAWTTL